MGTAKGTADWLLDTGDSLRPVEVSSLMRMDDDAWRGTIERVTPSEGLRVFLGSTEIHREVRFEVQQAESDPWLFSHVTLDGLAELSFVDGVSAALSPSRTVIFRPAACRGTFRLAPQRSYRHVALGIRPDRARRMLGSNIDPDIDGMLDATSETRLIAMASSTRISRMASSAFARQLRGALRMTFLEGIALQIWALHAHAARARLPRTTLAAPELHRRLNAAREELLANIASPPNSATLAANAGISERELNAGFRKLFGGTVYEVLRNERLAHARLVIEAGGLPIKEVAHRIGYNHVSNFTAAFTRRFGTPPGRYIRAATPAKAKTTS